MAELTSDEERLVELLTTMGATDPDALQEALDEFRNARGAGDDVELGPFLVGRGLVSVSVVQQLFTASEDQPVGAASRASAHDDSGEHSAGERPPLADGRPRVELTDPRRADGSSSGDAPAIGEESSIRAVEAQAIERAVKRKSRALKRISDEVSIRRASARGRTQPSSESPLEESDLPDVETRRFDLEALAAASSRRDPKRPLLLVPALVAGALVAVAGGVVWFGAQEPVEDDDPPTKTSRTTDEPPLDDEPFAHTAPVTSGATHGGELPRVEERARRLEAREQYTAAIALYAGLPTDVRSRQAELIERAVARLQSLERYRLEAERLLKVLAPFRNEKLQLGSISERRKLERALADLEAHLSAKASLSGSATGQRLREVLFELTLRWDEARAAKPSGETRREPKHRAQRFAAAAREGRKNVSRMRLAIARKKAELGAARKAEAKRARDSSQASPLSLNIGGTLIRKAVVVDFDPRGFALLAGRNRLAYEWGSLIAKQPALALTIRKLPVRSDDAGDHLRLGRWCLEHRLFDAAKQAFGRAVLLDARLRNRIPDVTAIARSSRVFKGRLKRDKPRNLITVTYGFARSAENADFEFRSNVKGGVNAPQGRLQIQGKGLSLGALKEVGFQDWLEVTATFGPASRGTAIVFGVSFAPGTRKETTYLAALNRARDEVLFVRARGRQIEVLDRRKGALRGKFPKLLFELRNDRLRIRTPGGRSLFKLHVSAWEKLRVVVGGASAGFGRASIQHLVVRGRVRRAWLRKAFGEFDAMLRAFLARTEDLSLFARPPGRPPRRSLSAEDAFGLEGVSKKSRAYYQKGRVRASMGGALDLLAAANAFGKAIESSPQFAAAYYRRALVLEALGRPLLAVTELERAMARCPRFFEAMAERARLLASQGDLAGAAREAERALRIRPDHPPALTARARVAFSQGRLKDALADLDLALALDPWNGTVRTFRRNVNNVIKGPPWEKTYRKETRHYVVKTDISAARCLEYARDLEVMRGYYTKLFGEARKGVTRKATVLIFDTREGFHAYAELTTDDRVESLLGCYLPRYRQLLLYEDRDDANLTETRRVLFHEAFHQFIGDVIPDMPYWLNEGFADYFSTSLVKDGRVVERGGTLLGRLKDLRRFVARRGGPIPFPRIMQESPAKFYSGPVAAKYAQAWAMVHFLQRAAPEGLKARFRRYLGHLREGLPSRRAFQQAWSKVDWQHVQRIWWSHVQKL